MTESSTSNNFAQLKRVLIGGLLSASAAGIIYYLYAFKLIVINTAIMFFMILGFELPAMLFDSLNQIVNTITVTVIWFLIGGAVTYFIKTNKRAFVFWLVTYIIFCVAAFIVFVLAWSRRR